MKRTVSPLKRRHIVLVYLGAGLLMTYMSYCLPRLLPGNFIEAVYSDSQVTLNAKQEAELKAYYTEEKEFGRYLLDLLSLNWGYSYAYLTPVSTLFLEALPWTLLLMGGAHMLAMFLGFAAGVEAAFRRGGWFERAGVGAMTILEGIPEIGSGILILLIFALYLGWFPAAGAETAYAKLSAGGWVLDVIHHLTLPLATLVLAYFPGNFLLARGSLVMVLKNQYVQTARAKGLSPRRIRYVHAARNALLPMITRFGLRITFMVTGALVVETIHSYPGLGTLLFNAIAVRDLPLIQAIVLFSSLFVLALNLGLEWTYRRLDPRVTHAS